MARLRGRPDQCRFAPRTEEVRQKYGIMSSPTLTLCKGGKAAQQIAGAVPESRLEPALEWNI